MIEKNRRDKLMSLIKQIEKITDDIACEQPDFLMALEISRTICDDIRSACQISETSELILLEKLERIRRMYETGK